MLVADANRLSLVSMRLTRLHRELSDCVDVQVYVTPGIENPCDKKWFKERISDDDRIAVSPSFKKAAYVRRSRLSRDVIRLRWRLITSNVGAMLRLEHCQLRYDRFETLIS